MTKRSRYLRKTDIAHLVRAATGVTGLVGHSPVREHIWFDPAEDDNGARPKKRAAKAGKGA